MKTIGRMLLVGWALLALGVALTFAWPKPASRILHPISLYLQLIPMTLLVVTGLYGLIRVYRAGVARK